jgi:hypothetical protein
MQVEIDRAFLDETQPTDSAMRLRYADNGEGLVIEIAAEHGTISVTLELEDAKKFATRIYAAVKRARGELPERSSTTISQ